MKLLKKLKSPLSASPVSPTPLSPEAESIEFLRRQSAPFKAVLFIDRLVQSGSVYIREEASEVYISTKLVYLYADRKRWSNFLRAVGLWFSFQKSREQWKRRFIDAENEAIRATGKTPEEIGEAGLAQLKWDARQKVRFSEADVSVSGKYNFVLVSESDGEPVLVGSFDDGRIRMKSYDEVKHLFNL